MKNEKQEILVGMIGLGLSAGLWLLSSWRLVFHTLVRREQEQLQELPIEESEARRSSQPSLQSSSTTKWLTRRRTFHALLWYEPTAVVFLLALFWVECFVVSILCCSFLPR